MSSFTAIYKGSVYDVNDPLGRGRVRVLVPQVLGEAPSAWANPTLAVTGLNTAQVKDRVWVLFEGGDINRPTYMSRMTVTTADLDPDVLGPLGQSLADLQVIIDETEAALEDLRETDLPVLRGQLETLNNVTLPDLNSRLTAAQQAFDNFEDNVLPGIILDIDQAQQDVATLNTTVIPALNADLASARVDINTLRTVTIPALNADLVTARADLNTLQTATLPALRADLTTARSDLTALATRLSTAETDINTNRASLNTLNNTTLPALRADLTTARSDLTALTGRLSTAETDITTNRGSLNTLNNTTLPALNAELDQTQADLATLGQFVTTVDGRVTTTVASVATLNNTTIPALRTDLTTSQGQVDTLRNTTIPGLSTDLTAARNDLTTLSTITIPGVRSESLAAANQAYLDAKAIADSANAAALNAAGIASGRGRVFYQNTAPVVPALFTNAVDNPEPSATGYWVPTNAATLSYVTSNGRPAVRSTRVSTATYALYGGRSGAFAAPIASAVGGEVITMVFTLMSSAALTITSQFGYGGATSTTAVTGGNANHIMAANVPQTFRRTFTIPTSGAWVGTQIFPRFQNTTGAVNDYFDVYDVMWLVNASNTAQPYFSGNSPDAATQVFGWAGTPNNSRSIAAGSDAGVSLWIDTTGGANKPYRWKGTWTATSDAGIQAAATAAATAQSAAQAAQTAADAARGVADNAQGRIDTLNNTTIPALNTALANARTDLTALQNFDQGVFPIVETDIQDGAISTRTMTANSINGDRITANTLSALKIIAGTIVTELMTANTINGDRVATNTLDAGRITAGTITTDRMTANSIHGDRISAGTLSALKIIAGTIITDRMTANTIAGDRITANTLNADRIVAGSISTDRMTANTISGDRIQANTLTADKIVANSITSDQIASNTITANRLNVVVGGGNLLSDSSFESTTLTGWALLGATGARTTATARRGGTTSFQVTQTTSGGFQGLSTPTASRIVGLAGNTTYTISAWVRPDDTTPAPNVRLSVQWFDAAAAAITVTGTTGPSVTLVAANGWQRVSTSFTSPAAAVSARINIGTATVNTAFWVDDIQFEQGDVMTSYAPRTNEILPGTIITSMMLADSIHGDRISAGTLSALKIVAGTIITDRMTANTINGDRITVNTLDAGRITAGTIATDRMTANTITGDRITTNTLDAGRITAGTITTDRMTANTINGDRITTNTLNADRIVAGSIATDRMTANTITGDRITANTLDAGRIVAGTITTDRMTANTINGDRINTNTLNADRIVAGSITTDRMTANTINGDRITANTLNADRIVAGTITTDRMTANTINGDRISAGTLNANKIVANTITGAQILAGSITTESLSVASLGSSILPNGGFIDVSTTSTTGVARWSKVGGTGTFTRVTAASMPNGVRLNTSVSQNNFSQAASDVFPIDPAKTYAITGKIGTGGQGAEIIVRVVPYDVTGAAMSGYVDVLANVTVTNAFSSLYSFAGQVSGLPAAAVGASVHLYAYAGSRASTVVGYTDITCRPVVVSAQIADGAIIADKIFAGAITSTKIFAGAVTADSIATGAIVTRTLAAETLTAIDVRASNVVAERVQAGIINGITINGNTITGSVINGGQITGVTVTATTFNGGTLNGSTLTTATVDNPNGERIVIRNDGNGGIIEAFSGIANEVPSVIDPSGNNGLPSLLLKAGTISGVTPSTLRLSQRRVDASGEYVLLSGAADSNSSNLQVGPYGVSVSGSNPNLVVGGDISSGSGRIPRFAWGRVAVNTNANGDFTVNTSQMPGDMVIVACSSSQADEMITVTNAYSNSFTGRCRIHNPANGLVSIRANAGIVVSYLGMY